jgi:hypothetical protein
MESMTPSVDLAGKDGQAVLDLVLSVWSRHLGSVAARPSDNFFDLGGASLAAVLIVADLALQLGIDDIPIELLFETDNAYDFAKALHGLF